MVFGLSTFPPPLAFASSGGAEFRKSVNNHVTSALA